MHRDLAICVTLPLVMCCCGTSPTRSSAPSANHETASASPPDGSQTRVPESGSGGPHRHRKRGPRGSKPSQGNGGAVAGQFDFYVMSLSWSPGFCATAAGQNDPLQCGPERHFAFVLHGLWPQYQQGGWPQDCSTEAADESLVNSMLTIMPSPKLVAHEWEKHGTCSGLSPKDYFEEAAEAFDSVKISLQYKAPQRQITVSPDQLRHDFAAANPKIGDQGLVVLCSSNGRYLHEVRTCLTLELNGRPCNAEVLRDACKSNQIIMRPVR